MVAFTARLAANRGMTTQPNRATYVSLRLRINEPFICISTGVRYNDVSAGWLQIAHIHSSHLARLLETQFGGELEKKTKKLPIGILVLFLLQIRP